MPASQSYTTNSGQKNTISSPFLVNGSKYRTETVATLDNGKVTAGTQLNLQKEVTKRGGKDYQTYATSYDGGKTWVTPGSSRTGGGKPITPANTGLTSAEIKALQPGGNLNKAALNSSTSALKKNDATPAQIAAATSGKEQPKSENTKPIEDPIVEETNQGLPGAGKQYIYPKSMNSKQDCIVFNMLEYSPKALTDTTTTTNNGNNPLQLGKRSSDRKSLGSVRLPIQGGIVDGNAVTWGEDRLNALDLYKINVAKQTISGGFAAGGQTAQAGAEKAGKDFVQEKGTMGDLFTQAVTGKNALTRADGSIVNENLELLFQGPTLRTFNFSFKMSARDEPEAKEIANIIRFFKQGMAAKRTKNEYFLKSPNTFEIKYFHNGKENHPGVNQIKECALQTCNVNYTPDGNYAAHADGYLVSYNVSLQFQELEPVYNDEYSGFTDVIGY